MQPDIPVDISVSYTSSVSFIYPNLSVQPPVCGTFVHHSCHYTSGPYTGGIDLCNFNMGSCYATFDITVGTYVFNCDDSNTFPPGQYTFTITTVIEVVVTEVTFIMNICHDTVPIITNDPFGSGSFYYVIGEAGL